MTLMILWFTNDLTVFTLTNPRLYLFGPFYKQYVYISINIEEQRKNCNIHEVTCILFCARAPLNFIFCFGLRSPWPVQANRRERASLSLLEVAGGGGLCDTLSWGWRRQGQAIGSGGRNEVLERYQVEKSLFNHTQIPDNPSRCNSWVSKHTSSHSSSTTGHSSQVVSKC